MAIFRLSAGIVKRSQGQSAVAAAAYRAGENLHDERLDVTHHYDKKQDVLRSEILAPEGSPEWVTDREKLWNKFEAAERQWNGQPAREVVLSLPRELSDAEGWKLARKFVNDEFVSKGMVADMNFHKPKSSDGKSNPHVHVLMTMRRIVDGEPNTKKERQWNRDFTDGGKSENDEIGGFKNTKGRGDGWVGKDTAGLKGMRLRWAESANSALADNGVDARISALSNLELGKQHAPQPKMGKAWHSVDPKAAILHQHRDKVRTQNSLLARSQRAQTLKPEIRPRGQQSISEPYANPYGKKTASALGRTRGQPHATRHHAAKTATQQSKATTVAQRYAEDEKVLKGLYSDHKRGWHAEHDTLQENDKGIEQGKGW